MIDETLNENKDKECIMDLYNNLSFIFTDISKDDKQKCIQALNATIKTFDECFLDFINIRKARDLYIINIFYNIVIENFNKNNKNNKNNLHQLYKINGIFDINCVNALILNNSLDDNFREIPRALKEKIYKLKIIDSILKNLFIEAQELKINNINIEQLKDNIYSKMQKIFLLTDQNFIDILTNDDKIKKILTEKLLNSPYEKLIINSDEFMKLRFSNRHTPKT